VPHKTLIEEKIHQYLGDLMACHEDYITATFLGPSKAVHCAMDVQEISKLYGVNVSQGLHIGEINILENEDSASIPIEITNKILDHAEPNQILLTNTVSNLLSGTGLNFSKFGLLSISPRSELQILLLDESMSNHNSDSKTDFELHFSSHTPRNHSLLEDVMQSIENHLTDEYFSINALSKDLGISTRQLQRKIKAITNKSPNSLIRSVRLHKAKELILQKEKSVKEAAFSTGFNSVSYFSSCFKKEFGDSPSMI